MIEDDGTIDDSSHHDGKHGHDEGRNRCLHLHQRDVAEHHLEDLTPPGHVAQVRLCREARRKTHVQVTL